MYGKKVNFDQDLFSKYPNLPYTILCAALGVRLASSGVNKSELIRNHMAWVLSVDPASQDYDICYPAEGVFNSVLAYILFQNAGTLFSTKYLQEIFATRSFKEHASSERIAEMVYRLFFLFAFFKTESIFEVTEQKLQLRSFPIKREDSKEQISSFTEPMPKLANAIFAPRSLKKFLETFIPSEYVAEYFSKEPASSEALLSFAYVQRSSDVSDPMNLSKAMFYKGSARSVTGKNWRGADLLIPLAYSSGRYGLLLVQVNYYSYSLFESGKELRQSTKDKIKELRLESVCKFSCTNEACPTVRLFVNFNAELPKKFLVGGDEYGPYLLLETNCSGVYGDRYMFYIIQEAIRKLNEGCEGRFPQIEADYNVPPL